MYDVYCNIFLCMGLDFRVVIVDFGFIGGNYFYEFYVFVVLGEDDIVFLSDSDYVVNVEMVEVVVFEKVVVLGVVVEIKDVKGKDFNVILKSVEVEVINVVKVVVVKVVNEVDSKGEEVVFDKWVVFVFCVDYEFNDVKVEKLDGVVSLFVEVLFE